MTASGSNASFESAKLLTQGLTFHQAGQLQEAFNVYQEILAVEPAHTDALHLTGEVLYRAGQYQNALQYLNHAIEQTPHHFYINTRSLVFLEMRLLQEAENDLLRAIKLVPNYLEAHINISNVYRSKANFKKAKLFAEKALQLEPASAAAFSALGAVQMETNQLDDALVTFSKSLELAPHAFATVKNVIKILAHQKKWQTVFPKLVENKDVQDFEIQTLLSKTNLVLGHTEKAIEPFQRAMRIGTAEERDNYLTTQPGIEHLLAMADALGVFRSDFSGAAELYQIAILSLPQHTTLINNLAVAQFNQAAFEQSILNLRKLLELDPNNAQARTNLGVSLIMCNQSEEAIKELEITLQKEPDFLPAAGWLIGEKNRICDWSGLPELRKRVAHMLDNPKNSLSVNSFILLSNYDDPKKLVEWSRINAKENFANLGVQQAPASGSGRKHSRIRVGYFSVDFRHHPVAHLTAPLYGLHDRSEFEIWVYSYGPDDKHPVRQRIQSSVEHFVNLEGCSIQGMVERIRSDEIDILVDLSGNTRGAKIRVLGHRPAPVQMHWLGFIGSMGSKYYDYTIVDQFVAPDGADEFFDEKLLRMPDCFQINDTNRPLQPELLQRAEFGLPEHAFVFADFNQSFKIQPEIFAAWTEIIKAVPNSVLWLADGHHAYIKNIRAAWAEAGLDSSRLIIAPRTNVDRYLAQFQLVDLFLDVFPYTSGTTASDALWAGCPLLALVGKTMVARMAGSLVKAAGLPELLTYSIEEYKDRAIHLAKHSDELLELRKKLMANRLNAPLFNTAKFVANLESAYKQITQMSWAGEELKPVTIN